MEPVPGKYRLLMEYLPDAFAYHQIVTDSSGNQRQPAAAIRQKYDSNYEIQNGHTIAGTKIVRIFQE